MLCWSDFCNIWYLVVVFYQKKERTSEGEICAFARLHFGRHIFVGIRCLPDFINSFLSGKQNLKQNGGAELIIPPLSFSSLHILRPAKPPFDEFQFTLNIQLFSYPVMLLACREFFCNGGHVILPNMNLIKIFYYHC